MNIREIAQLAGVSISTVSKVLNRKDQAISEETRRKVLAVMKENHYQPYVVSRFYGSSHSFLIGAVLCKRPGIERFLETLMEAAAQQGYSVLARFAQSPEEEKEALEVLRGYPLDGLVLCRGMEFEEEPDLESLGVPTCVLQLTRGKTSPYPGLIWSRPAGKLLRRWQSGSTGTFSVWCTGILRRKRPLWRACRNTFPKAGLPYPFPLSAGMRRWDFPQTCCWKTQRRFATIPTWQRKCMRKRFGKTGGFPNTCPC